MPTRAVAMSTSGISRQCMRQSSRQVRHGPKRIILNCASESGGPEKPVGVLNKEIALTAREKHDARIGCFTIIFLAILALIGLWLGSTGGF